MQLNERDWKKTFDRIYEGDVKFSVPMKDHTNLGIGGPADVMVLPVDPLSIRNMIKVFGKEDMPFLPLGWGTNIVVRDKGIAGVVISLRAFDRIEVLKEGHGHVELFVEAGVPLQKLVNFCSGNGYAGIEGLTGIPGTVGGAICGNAGSFGYEMKDALVSVAIMDSDGVLERFKAEGLGFGYRKSDLHPTDLVLSANMRLKKDESDQVSARTENFFMEKKQKQPISEKSAGCVFKNPEGMSAGRLIDEAGCKGMKIGEIEVSPLHANFFINKGEGRAEDYISLMDEVAAIVNNKYGVALEPEIKIIGRI